MSKTYLDFIEKLDCFRPALASSIDFRSIMNLIRIRMMAGDCNDEAAN
jgi:hypothetical protein